MDDGVVEDVTERRFHGASGASGDDAFEFRGRGEDARSLGVCQDAALGRWGEIEVRRCFNQKAHRLAGPASKGEASPRGLVDKTDSAVGKYEKGREGGGAGSFNFWSGVDKNRVAPILRTHAEELPSARKNVKRAGLGVIFGRDETSCSS